MIDTVRQAELMKLYVAHWAICLPYQIALIEMNLEVSYRAYSGVPKNNWGGLDRDSQEYKDWISQKRMRADVFRFDIFTHESIIYEVKTSVRDFKSDKKMAGYLDYANKLYIVIPDTIFGKIDVPKEFGLMVISHIDPADKHNEPWYNPHHVFRRHIRKSDNKPKFGGDLLLPRVLTKIQTRMEPYLYEMEHLAGKEARYL